MSGAYSARRVQAQLNRHGQDMTLKRRKSDGTWDSLTVKGRIFNPRLQAADFDGEAGTMQRIRIGNTEISTSTLPTRWPTEKDQIVVDGVTLSIVAVNTLKDAAIVQMHVLEVEGVGV